MEILQSLPENVTCDMITGYASAVTESRQVVQLTKAEQHKVLGLKELQCACRIQKEPETLTGPFCPRHWDDVMCWDDTPAPMMVQQPCPAYINSFSTQNIATKICLADGTWFVNPSHDHNGSDLRGWTNYTACYDSVPEQPSSPSPNVPDLFIKHMHEFRIMYNVGYGLSLITLVFAFIIMAYFRKLHCSRNTIHLNLFAAFICRAGMSLLRDNLMVNGIGFARDMAYNESRGGLFFTEGPHWECRLFFSVFQYALTASYFWIFMEAVYLHVLIFITVLNRKVRVIWYILFGWSVPLLIVIIWSLSRYFFNNTHCWNLYFIKPGLIWIINGPIMLTVLINSIFFVRLVRVLYTKLQASPCPEGKRHKYRRLARSTMFLVPVFGVHYIIFAVPTQGLNDTVTFVMLFIEMFFNSYQGFFIALVLCFINAEVRAEVKKAWRRRALRRGSEPLSKLKFSKSLPECNGTVCRNGTANTSQEHTMTSSERDVTQGHLRNNSEELPFLADTASSIKMSELHNPSNSDCCALKSDSTGQGAIVQDTSKLLFLKNNNVLERGDPVIGCNVSVDDNDTQPSEINRLSVL